MPSTSRHHHPAASATSRHQTLDISQVPVSDLVPHQHRRSLSHAHAHPTKPPPRAHLDGFRELLGAGLEKVVAALRRFAPHILLLRLELHLRDLEILAVDLFFKRRHQQSKPAVFLAQLLRKVCVGVLQRHHLFAQHSLAAAHVIHRQPCLLQRKLKRRLFRQLELELVFQVREAGLVLASLLVYAPLRLCRLRLRVRQAALELGDGLYLVALTDTSTAAAASVTACAVCHEVA